MFDIESEIENPEFANFKPVRWSNKDLLRQESAIYHSNKLWFDAEVAEKLLDSIYYRWTIKCSCQ